MKQSSVNSIDFFDENFNDNFIIDEYGDELEILDFKKNNPQFYDEKSEHKVVTIRKEKAVIDRNCNHPKNERTYLPFDEDCKYNSCSMCAAEAASQIEGGLTYQEIGDLLGVSKMYALFLEKSALSKLKKKIQRKEWYEPGCYRH